MKNIELKQYWRMLFKKEKEEFCILLGVSKVVVANIANGHQKPTTEQALKIESITKGAVSPESLMPHINWAYVRKNEVSK